MLLSVFKEHCDLSLIKGVDAENLLGEQILPSVLAGGASIGTVQRDLSLTMKSLHCVAPGTVARVQTPKAETPAVAGEDRAMLQPSTFIAAKSTARVAVDAVDDNKGGGATPTNTNQDTSTRLKAAADTSAQAANELQQGARAIEYLAYCRTIKKGESLPDVCRPAPLKSQGVDRLDYGPAPSCADLPAQARCPGDLSDLSDRQQALNLQAYHSIKDQNDLAQKLDKGSHEAALTQSYYDAAAPYIEQSGSANMSRVAQYGIYAGPNYSLSGDGSWKAGGEFLARFDNAVISPGDGGSAPFSCFRWFIWCRGYSEFSYQTIAALDKSKTSAQAPFDPFAQSGGYFRFNAGWRMHLTEWFGFEAGAGLSSLPNGGGTNETKLKVRETLGVHLQTIFSDGALGQLFFGTAHDKFWTRSVLDDPSKPDGPSHLEKNRSRWIVDGLVMFPDLDVGGWKMAGRLSADTPTDGHGPSDVRASLLLYYPLNGWIQSNLPKKSATGSQ